MSKRRWKDCTLTRWGGIYLFGGSLLIFAVPAYFFRTAAAWRSGGDFLGHSWFYWLATAVVNIAIPLVAIVYDRRRLRKEEREYRMHKCQCVKCGYLLTGNVSGVCPECGAACKAANPPGASPAAGD